MSAVWHRVTKQYRQSTSTIRTDMRTWHCCEQRLERFLMSKYNTNTCKHTKQRPSAHAYMRVHSSSRSLPACSCVPFVSCLQFFGPSFLETTSVCTIHRYRRSTAVAQQHALLRETERQTGERPPQIPHSRSQSHDTAVGGHRRDLPRLYSSNSQWKLPKVLPFVQANTLYSCTRYQLLLYMKLVLCTSIILWWYVQQYNSMWTEKDEQEKGTLLTADYLYYTECVWYHEHNEDIVSYHTNRCHGITARKILLKYEVDATTTQGSTLRIIMMFIYSVYDIISYDIVPLNYSSTGIRVV